MSCDRILGQMAGNSAAIFWTKKTVARSDLAARPAGRGGGSSFRRQHRCLGGASIAGKLADRHHTGGLGSIVVGSEAVLDKLGDDIRARHIPRGGRARRGCPRRRTSTGWVSGHHARDTGRAIVALISCRPMRAPTPRRGLANPAQQQARWCGSYRRCASQARPHRSRLPASRLHQGGTSRPRASRFNRMHGWRR